MARSEECKLRIGKVSFDDVVEAEFAPTVENQRRVEGVLRNGAMTDEMRPDVRWQTCSNRGWSGCLLVEAQHL